MGVSWAETLFCRFYTVAPWDEAVSCGSEEQTFTRERNCSDGEGITDQHSVLLRSL